jgi:hypothetical protein
MQMTRGRGRPTSFKPEYVAQAEKLCALGATDQEIADFFEGNPTSDDFFSFALAVIRSDRRGVIAARKKDRAERKVQRRKSDPSFRLVESVRARMWAALKGRSDGALFSRLGYTAAELMSWLENRFQPGMTWENYGKWHVDHIKPVCAFDQSVATEFAECWALENLQPLWAKDNIRKSGHVAA